MAKTKTKRKEAAGTHPPASRSIKERELLETVYQATYDAMTSEIVLAALESAMATGVEAWLQKRAADIRAQKNEG